MPKVARNTQTKTKSSPNTTFTKFLIILTVLLILLPNACKAQTSGWDSHQGTGLGGAGMYTLLLLISHAIWDEEIVLTESGEVYYSYDDGYTWHLDESLTGIYHAIWFMSTLAYRTTGPQNISTDSVCVAGNAGAIYFSSNGGTNWVQQTSGITGDIYSVCFADNHDGWAADDGGHIVHTTNAGTNWVLQSSLSLTIFKLFFSDISNGWVTGFGSFVKYTSNGGANWIDRTPPNVDPTGYIWSMQFIDQNTGWMAGQNYGSYSLFRTTNGGVHWDSCTVSPAPSIIWGLSFVNASTGYACGPSVIFKTTNGGINWTSQTLPSGTPILYDIKFANADTGFAVGQNATILYTTSGGEPIGIKPISSNVPDNFALGQNYPNPFNPSTKFRFDISSNVKSETSNVKVEVYDVIGRELTTLVNEPLKPGTYEVSWDASNFPSGVYFYRLTAGEFVQTKRMVLLK